MAKIIPFKLKQDKRVYVILALLLLSTIALVYINLVHSAYNKVLQLSRTSIMSLEDSAYTFGKAEGMIIVCGQEGLTAIDKNGGIAWKYVYSHANPTLSAAGNYSLYSDLNGYSCRLVSKGNLVATYESANSIITAKVNKNGYFAVATKERGYKSQILVFDNRGEEIYAWHSTKYFVLNVAVSEDNKSMFVSVLNTDSGDNSICKVLYFSFSPTGEPTILDTGMNNLVSGLETDGSHVFAVGDTALYSFDKNGKKQFSISYDGRTVQEYAVGGGTIAIALTKGSVEGYYGGSVVEAYNTRGSCRGTFEVNDEITFLDIDGNKILVNSEDGAYILKDNCRLYGNLTFENNVRDGLIFAGGRKLMLVNGSSVNIYDSK